jgi:hypothetical protein
MLVGVTLLDEIKESIEVILSEGITSMDASRDRHKREEVVRTLKKQVEDANNILGVKKIYTFDFPDNRFDTANISCQLFRVALIT